MTHHHEHHDHHHGHPQPPRRRAVHKDWRAWLVVILMLAAMWMYLRTMDLSFSPSGEVKPGMPAAPGPPAPTPVGMRSADEAPRTWLALPAAVDLRGRGVA